MTTLAPEHLAAGLAAIAQLDALIAQMTPEPFPEWLAHVSIESDPEEGGTGGPVPFALYPYQRERAESWAAGTSECILKTRQIGMSWLAAAYFYWVAAYHQASHVGAWSAGELEVHQLMGKVSYIHEHLPPALRAAGKIGVESAVFTSGSTITGYPATRKAGIGTTLALAFFDEAAFHAYLRENMGAVVPALGSFGQLIVQSTADPSLGASGHFSSWYWDSVAGKTTCQAVFLPADIRPGRDAAWFERERRKYIGDDTSFRAYYPFTDSEAFLGRTGLVYGVDHLGVELFKAKRTAGSSQRCNVEPAPCTWEKCKWRLLAIDPGGTDPNCIVAIGVSQDERIHVYGQFYQRGTVSITEYAEYCAEWDARKRFDYLLYDPAGGAQTGAELSRFFGPERVKPANNDKTVRLSYMKQVLRERRLTYDPVACPDLLKEFSSYWYVPRSENAIGGTSAVQTRAGPGHHADGLDAVGYGVVAIFEGMPVPTGPREVRIVGRPANYRPMANVPR